MITPPIPSSTLLPSLPPGTGGKASKGKGLKMLGLDAAAATTDGGFDFSLASGPSRKTREMFLSALVQEDLGGSSDVWKSMKTRGASCISSLYLLLPCNAPPPSSACYCLHLLIPLYVNSFPPPVDNDHSFVVEVV